MPHASAILTTSGGAPCNPLTDRACFDDGAGSFRTALVSQWVYSAWPRGFRNYADGLNASYASDDTYTPRTVLNFDYETVFDDGARLVLKIAQPLEVSRLSYSPANSYWVYSPALWDAWVWTAPGQSADFDAFAARQPTSAQWVEAIDNYVRQAKQNWSARQTSFLHDVIPLAVAFAAIVASGGGLSGTAGGAAGTGEVAATSAIPETIAAPGAAIPEYIAAGTAPAALPIDAALATDASSIGLAGGVETAAASSWFSEAASQVGGKLAATGEKLIAGKVAQEIAPKRPTPAAPATGSPGEPPAGARAAAPGLFEELLAELAAIVNGLANLVGSLFHARA